MFTVLKFSNLTVAKWLRWFTMGKVKYSGSSRLRHCVSEFKDVFTPGSKVFFCRAYGKSIVAQQRSLVTQYLRGSKHTVAVVGLGCRPGRQSLIGDSSVKTSSSGLPNLLLLRQICAKHLCP
jgi:hypothetical protein